MEVDTEDSNRIITAVRIRPLSSEETSKGSNIVASADYHRNEIILLNPVFFKSSQQTERLRKLEERRFACDHVFWSVEETHADYCGQEDVYSKVGSPIVQNALAGLNCCMFAYGKDATVVPSYYLFIICRANR